MNLQTAIALGKLLMPPLVLCSWACGQGVSTEQPLASIIRQVERAQSEVPPYAYQVIREYRIFGAKTSSADSDVVAEVNFSPPNKKDYKIQSRSGGSRGEQVVRRILDHEVAENRPLQSAAMTEDNYRFTYRGEALLNGQPCYVLGLDPRRKAKELVSGRAWVDKGSFLVRQIEGEMAKTPSWWLKKVYVKLAFAAVQGTWLQTGMEAVADVRFLGTHTLTSQIVDYRLRDVVAATGELPTPRISDRRERRH